MELVVTIDGPAGSGKSTVAREVARRLGWRLLDSGAMYRVVTLAAVRSGVEPTDAEAMGELAERIQFTHEGERVWMDGEDVTTAIREDVISRSAHHAAENGRVRRCLVGWQRATASREPTVAEGRDLGTVVFPGAPCKFYLTADPLTRACRRHAELARKEPSISLERVFLDLRARDSRDRNRELSPLREASDALIVDTTGVTTERVVEEMERALRERLGEVRSEGRAGFER